MLIVPIQRAEPGMTLAAPVTHPGNPSHDLLRAGYVLQADIIPKLAGMGVPALFVAYPGLEDLDKHLAPLLSPARQRLFTQIKETIAANQSQRRPSVGYHDYYASTRELVLTLMTQGEHPVYLDQLARLGDDLVGHSAAVAHLALMLGIRLRGYLVEQRKRLAPSHASEVVNIGVGGMLHDMGKLKLPADQQGRTIVDAADDPAYRAHCEQGYELIRHGVEPSAAAAVLHHHQRWDGTGFPPMKRAVAPTTAEAARGMTTRYVHEPPAESRIHVFARVLYAADLFDRIANPPGRPKRENFEALALLRARYGSAMDPVVHRTLEEVAPAFPPGTQLTLSDGSSAVVIAPDPADTFRPVVRLLVEGVPVESSPIKLRERPELGIVTAGHRPAPALDRLPALAAA